MSYTPGPWHVSDWDEVDEISCEDNIEPFNGLIAVSFRRENTNLIAASLDLLEALEDRYSQTKCGCGHPHCKRCQMDAESQAAIDKAYGNK